jgi:cytochrome c-type biogenesis protein
MDPLQLLELMGTSGIPLLAAFSFGLMMAISPCTLATSLTAAVYLSQVPADRFQTIILGGLYLLGRMVTYAGLACLIVFFSLNIAAIASFLQQYGERLLTPVLILIGIWMLDLIPVHEVQHFGILVRLQAGASRMFAQRRFTGSFFLGVLFALSFCPVGIVFYFGMLIPLAYRMGDPVVIPSVFAIATALPTIGISLIITMGLFSLGSMLPILQKANVWMQRIVGIVFLLVGIYYLPRLFGF